MPVYAYKGINAAGKNVTGTRDADNPRTIKQNLKREGIFITELAEAAQTAKQRAVEGDRFAAFRERVSSQELAIATRQLATLIGAGIPLVESLNALVDQIDSPVF